MEEPTSRAPATNETNASFNQEIESQEPIRVITVRLPKSLKEALTKEAHRREISLNKLAVEQLRQAIPKSQLAEAGDEHG